MHIIKINDPQYPNSLKQIKNPPQKLYAMGNIDLLNTDCITVVGSRKCSEYGVRMTRKFTKELANAELTIVSGLALRDRYHSTYRNYAKYKENNCGFREWV